VKFLRRLPVYATGAGFAALLLAIAEAREWSGLTLSLAGLGLALFYTVTILAPWLIREQLDETPALAEEPIYRAFFDLAPRNGANGASLSARTHGPPITEPSRPRVTTP
jgi:predicted RND superfamily exporter protein